ncbi:MULTISPECIES: tetratricopeptide repeat protein [unclassified Nodularia (in: cyanobacteria)]|uniref:tetratricopeptide repeat protein n=1 Tax=unclassified Nodularia (in: cyanobacteria) TaxID=2656917 RepID=UPI00188014EB|nr:MULTISPECIES: tetratricopeptide repeat protein [unclassified Nodularia (in: cyanobacteria)]MBE9201974.1 tetratricopeptide repeat protein [Nodularia sp. LEGE 06071]MCC2693855.1 tetratricopeptide repeat protein [Nodularia sp. LEGE 04288]
MKFTFSKPSVLAYASSILLLGFSIPLVAQIPASNAASECQTFKPPYLNTVKDFIGLGHFQEDCEKDSQSAVSSFTQAITLNPQGEEAYYHRANAYYNLGNYQAAVADHSEVIRQNTGRFGFSRGAYWNRARAYEKLGEKKKAISDLNQLIGDSSPNADQYFFRGNMYRDLNNKASAMADYKAAEKLLQQYLNGDFGNGLQDPRYQVMLENVRNELAQINY